MKKLLYVLLALLAISVSSIAMGPSHVKKFSTSTNLGLGYWPTDMSDDYQSKWMSTLKQANVDLLAIQIGNPFEGSEYSKKLGYWLITNKGKKYKTYIGFEPFTEDRKKLKPTSTGHASIFDREWQLIYGDIIVSYVKAHKPEYLNPCIEANMWYEHASTKEWAEFRDFYSSLYDRIKATNPSTKVFCSLQYELLSGQLYNNPTKQWELLDDPQKALPKQDLLGLSTYPYGGDYLNWYQGLQERETPAIFVAEMGYIHGHNDYPMSVPAENLQASLIEALPELFHDLQTEGLLWLTLADLDPKVVPNLPNFYYIFGLMHHNLQPKKAWNSWKNLKPSK